MSSANQFPNSPNPEQPPGPIVDHRPQARTALPRRAQMWLMLGLAGVLLGIILLTGNPTPTDRPPSRSTPLAVDTQRVTGFQQQLALREHELARQMAALEQEPTPPPIRPTESDNAASPPATPSDPLADERRRREYTSLFASNVALTTRTDRSASPGLDGAGPTVAPGSGGDPDVQALEAQGRQSLARLNASVAALEQATRIPQPAASARPTNPQVAESAPERTPAPSPTAAILPGGPKHRVLEGTVLEGVLMSRLDGDFAGPVMCLVTTPLYSHHGDAVLVPSGSKVLGRAKAVDTWGQRRLAVSFHRLLLPDGSSYPLDTFTGLNSIGDNGLRDRVNHHYWSTFGTSAAIGLVSGLAQYVSAGAISGGDGDGNRTVVITGSGAESAAQAAAQVLGKYTNRLPSITIREGHRVRVYFTQDMEFPAYVDVNRTLAPGGF